jgi:hypothetical protein
VEVDGTRTSPLDDPGDIARIERYARSIRSTLSLLPAGLIHDRGMHIDAVELEQGA